MLKASYYLAAVLALLTQRALAQDIPMKRFSALRTSEAMTIDGLAQESVWSRAPISAGFVERNPDLGGRPPVETTIQASYDDNNLYLLIRGKLPNRKARIQTLRRDSGDIFSDDTVSIKIDPLHDRRTVYAFAANLAGAQFDSLTLEDGRINFRRWDGVWEVKAQSDTSSFTLEYRIPFYVLGIKSQKSLEMGFNVTRMDPDRAADYDWRLIPPPRSPVGASTFGILSGISSESTKPVLELTPYGLLSTDFSRRFSINPTKSPNLAIGGDLRYQTGPGSYLEGSVLTDFSQVDVDQVIVANDRFPLYFPEQRPFFLNGADVFNFGLSQSAQLFFSRRVALDGVTAPVLGGIKAYGRNPKLSYGVMSVQTASAWQGDTRKKSPENFSALRLRSQALPQLALGVIGLGRKRFQSDTGDALSLGVDMDLQSRDSRFRSYSFFASSWQAPGENSEQEQKPASPGDRRWGKSVSNRTEFRSLYLRPSLTWIWSDKVFEAPLGFYERPHTAQHQAEVNFVPRPDFWGLRNLEIRPRFTLVNSPDYRSTLTYEGRMDLAVHTMSNWHGGYYFKGVQDRVQEDFTLFGNQKVLAGDYRNPTHTFWIDTPGQYPFWIWLSYEFGSRFGGPYRRLDGELKIRGGRHFLAKGGYTQFWGKLPTSAKRYNLSSANAQLVAALNTRLAFDIMLRMDLTPGKQQLGAQGRMRWRFLPGSDFFVVYANQHPLSSAAEMAGLKADHRLTLKLNWYLAMPMGG